MTKRKERVTNVAPDKKTRNFKMMDAIKANPLYKLRPTMKRDSAEQVLESNARKVNGRQAVAGTMLYFKYLTPLTEEELEYYDARPCTLFFGTFRTKSGARRVLGFNLHYYPPKARYNIVAQIYDEFRPVFQKYWDDPSRSEIDAFDYTYIIQMFRSKKKLKFGVREYDPSLMTDVRCVPTKWWSTAVMTEGWFRKATLNAIRTYWRQCGSSTRKSE